MKSKLTVRRLHGQALEVLVVLDNNGIHLETPIEQFINALVEEAGNPTLLVTKAGLKARLLAAVDPVESVIKDASREVIK